MLDSLPKNKANFYKKIAKNKFENQPYSAPAESYDDDVRAEAEDDAMLFVCKQKQKSPFLPHFQTNRIHGVLNNLPPTSHV